MRIYVKVNGYHQIYDVFGISVCDNNDIFLKVKDCGWEIVVKSVSNPISVMNEVLQSGYADLSSYAAYFPQYNTPAYASTDTDVSEREKDLFELEF